MSIIQLSKFNYRIKFGSSTKNNKNLHYILNSILNLLPGSMIVKSESEYFIDFFAQSVSFLNEMHIPLEYNDVVSMMYCLNEQNLFLINNYNCGLFYLNTNDIIVINSSLFVYTNLGVIRNMNSIKEFILNSPFSIRNEDSFFSPELLKLVTLPALINSNCFYYSLGILGIYCLCKKRIAFENISDIKDILKPIYQTKLYWAILRCLGENRSLLLI
jgi:hypothetical protein